MNIEDLAGPDLDAAVAAAEGVTVVLRHGQPSLEFEFDPEGPAHEFSMKEWKMWQHYSPSVNWAQGGPIIGRAKIMLEPLTETTWSAEVWVGAPGTREDKFVSAEGATPLIAAMRAYVKSKSATPLDEVARISENLGLEK